MMATAGVIGAVGDVSIQLIEGSAPADLDPRRTARLSVYRSVQAPIVDMAWQRFDRWITLPGMLGVAAKVVADQSLLMPPSLVCFFTSQGLMEGLSWEASLDRVRRSWLPTLQVCAPFWCTVHLCTFSLIPSHLRIAWASFAAVFWNAYISHANRQAQLSEQQEVASAAFAQWG
eukprot:CAMPEP_0179334330 /NCGR_PEP_ID=MMETSP0797-20121207/65878_1 /TAXON_ID=47934 /ORGANISM="Dinophysis acuminata, Strain DAEP01" /LENGTH=173 /DNA_ID=CAMNT_0021047595 /DNA_START=48 /DNA_END=566 /DNA_ORIENTATION=-